VKIGDKEKQWAAWEYAKIKQHIVSDKPKEKSICYHMVYSRGLKNTTSNPRLTGVHLNGANS